MTTEEKQKLESHIHGMFRQISENEAKESAPTAKDALGDLASYLRKYDWFVGTGIITQDGKSTLALYLSIPGHDVSKIEFVKEWMGFPVELRNAKVEQASKYGPCICDTCGLPSRDTIMCHGPNFGLQTICRKCIDESEEYQIVRKWTVASDGLANKKASDKAVLLQSSSSLSEARAEVEKIRQKEPKWLVRLFNWVFREKE